MPLLNGTVLAAAFLAPGVLSMYIALAPCARAIRRSSLSTRAFGLLLFSVTNWFVGLAAYSLLFGECGSTLMAIASSKEEIRSPVFAHLLTFPASVWNGAWIMLLTVAFTGFSVHALHSAALTGMAIHEFDLKCELPSIPASMRQVPRWWMELTNLARRSRFHLSRLIDGALRTTGLVDSLQPLGAGYWLVLLKAARILQWPNAFEPPDERVARVYADIVQGNEETGGHIGTLYKGTVKHMVCETDGNIVFVLLEQASRWRGHPADEPDGAAQKSAPRNPWRAIEKSEAFAIDGKNIRNINFRLVESKPVPVKDQIWAALAKLVKHENAAPLEDEGHTS